MKKIILFSAAGLLTTATIVYATVEKKPTVKEEAKKETVKKETKKNTNLNKERKRSCSWYN
jgi:hypothetical protein